MIAAIGTILAMLALVTLLGLFAFVAMAGAVVAVVACGDAPPVEIPARAAGIGAASLALLLFAAAIVALLDLVAPA